MGVLIIRILLFRVLYWDPLYSETPISIRLQNQDVSQQSSQRSRHSNLKPGTQGEVTDITYPESEAVKPETVTPVKKTRD